MPSDPAVPAHGEGARHVRSVALENFRGVAKGQLDGLASVNVLIGRNNSGKSTVIDGLTCLAVMGSGNPIDAAGRNRFGELAARRNESGEWPDTLWHQANTDQMLRVSASVQGANVSLTATRGPGRVEPSVTPDHSELAEHVRQVFEGLAVFRLEDATQRELETRLWSGSILPRRRDKTLQLALKQIFGAELESIQLPPDSRLLLLFSDYALPLDVQGDGARGALRCLMMQSVLQDTLYALEHPEGHMHPGALRRYAAVMCERAKAQRLQLLIATHSRECVQSFLDGAERAGSDAAVHHLRLEDGLLHTRRLEPDTVRELDDAGTDVRFLDLYE